MLSDVSCVIVLEPVLESVPAIPERQPTCFAGAAAACDRVPARGGGGGSCDGDNVAVICG